VYLRLKISEDAEFVSSDVEESAALAVKSRKKYDKAYQQFEDWCREKRVRDITEEVLLTYFEQKSRKLKGSTLWSNFEGLDLLEIFRTYFSLRPSPIEITRFFLGFRNGKCTRQAVGINTIGGVPKKIADFFNLPNSSNYTGHCFRRTSATLLADAGADITVLKRHKTQKTKDQILLPRDIQGT
jgi:integrase